MNLYEVRIKDELDSEVHWFLCQEEAVDYFTQCRQELLDSITTAEEALARGRFCFDTTDIEINTYPYQGSRTADTVYILEWGWFGEQHYGFDRKEDAVALFRQLLSPYAEKRERDRDGRTIPEACASGIYRPVEGAPICMEIWHPQEPWPNVHPFDTVSYDL